MKNKRNVILISLAATALVLLVVYFAFVRPLSDETVTTDPPVTTGPGEDVHGNTLCLFHIPREQIHAITVYNENGEFSFCRMPEEVGKEVTASSPFVILVKNPEDGKYIPYSHIKYNEEKFASLIVGAGTTYVMPQLIDSAAGNGGALDQEVLKEYGLADSDKPTYYEIQKLNGEIERVYVGDSAVTQGGYYLRREGYSGIYVSTVNRVGEVAKADITSFVEPGLSTLPAEHVYYYTKNFSLWAGSQTAVATAEDAVVLRFYSTYLRQEEGEEPITVTEEVELTTLDLRTCREALRLALLGQSAGACDLSVDISYAEGDTDVKEEWRGKTVTHRITEILRVEKLSISLNYVPQAERDDFSAFNAYTIIGPEGKLPFTPDNDNYMNVLQILGNLSGSKTVSLGITAEKLEEYGLNAYRIYYEFPIPSAEDRDDVFGEYMRNELCISERREDGSYYVASLLHDIIAEVDGETLSFLEEPNSYWFDNAVYRINVTNVSRLIFTFNYRDYQKTVTFELYQEVGEEDKKPYLSKVYVKEGEGERRELDKEAFLNLYASLTSAAYDGDVPDEKAEELLAGGSSVLELTVSLTNGNAYTYRFYPYTEHRVMVSVERKGVVGAYFYITSDEPKKLASDIEALLAGRIPEPDKRY